MKDLEKLQAENDKLRTELILIKSAKELSDHASYLAVEKLRDEVTILKNTIKINEDFQNRALEAEDSLTKCNCGRTKIL